VLPATFGVIQSDPPVLDPAGWYWSKINFDNGISGWVSAYPPYINSLQPPQMIADVAFTIVADYNGPAITQGVCLNDGLSSAATLQLQVGATGQTGSMICPQNKPGIGNHKVVVQAVNPAGTAASSEFQYSVTTAVTPMPPAPPANLRIGPIGGAQVIGAARDAAPVTNKPATTTPAPKPTPEKK
jgi:hypothetical protein